MKPDPAKVFEECVNRTVFDAQTTSETTITTPSHIEPPFDWAAIERLALQLVSEEKEVPAEVRCGRRGFRWLHEVALTIIPPTPPTMSARLGLPVHIDDALPENAVQILNREGVVLREWRV